LERLPAAGVQRRWQAGVIDPLERRVAIDPGSVCAPVVGVADIEGGHAVDRLLANMTSSEGR
jgi:hypothetical protein